MREVRSYFYSPIAYIVLVFFLLVSGVDFYFQIAFMNQRPVNYSVQEAFFNSVFFWFAFVLIFPLITMRLFSEEFKLGTIEPLMTAPVRDWQVVLAKFFGALFFYVILWLPTLLYFWIFQLMTHQPAASSPGAYWGSYLMLLLLGMFYISVGCLASVLTKNQIIAAIISFCAITLLFFLGLVQFILLDVSAATRDLLGYFSALEQMGTFSRGIIDTRPIVLYLSMTAFDADPDLSGVSIPEMENVMAEKTTAPAAPKKIHRLQIGMNVLIQILLLLFLVSADQCSIAIPALQALGFFARPEVRALRQDETLSRFHQRQGANHRFLRPEHPDHYRRAEPADGISIRGQGKNRRREHRSGAQPFAGQGNVREIQGGQ